MATEVAQPLADVPRPVLSDRKTLAAAFDSATDLSSNKKPSRTWSLRDLGYEQGRACSDFGVCEPFQLFTPSLVARLRNELLTSAVQDNCKFSSSRTPCCLRGVAEYSQLIKQLWSSPETTKRISEVAGVQLKPVFDYELGICNVQVPSAADKKANVDDWHTDSYPFVAVVLLSNPSPGGETTCMCGDGTEVALQYPTAGSCIVLQGSAVKHCARRVLSENPADARITMVTSYVPADPMAPDCSILRGPRLSSDFEILYCQWAEYRLQSLASKTARLCQEAASTRQQKGRLSKEAVQGLKLQCEEMIRFLKVTADEMVF